jgi:hypothetical protein
MTVQSTAIPLYRGRASRQVVREENEEFDRVTGAAKRTWLKKLALQPRKSAGRCEAQGRDTTNADPAFEKTSAVKSLAGRFVGC